MQPSAGPSATGTPDAHYPRVVVVLVVLAILASYAVIFWANRTLLLAGASDFSSFYAAGSIVTSHQGPHVYEYEAQKQAQAEFIRQVSFHRGPNPFNHAPFELLIYAPLSLLPFSRAVVVWFALNLGVLLLIVFLLRHRLALVARRLPWVLLGTALFYPVIIALVQGQDSLLILLIFTLMWMALADGRAYRAGALLALATMKPQLVLPFLLALLVARQWRVLLGFVAACVPLFAACVALVGWRTTVGYPQMLLAFSRLSPEIAAAYPERMPNLRGLIYALAHTHLSPGATQALVILCSLLLLVLVGWAARGEGGRFSDVVFSFVIAIALLTGYHTNIHDVALLALPFLLVLERLAAPRRAPERTPRPPLTKSLRRGFALLIAAIFIIPFAGLPPQVLCVAILGFALALFVQTSRRTDGVQSVAPTG